MHIIHLIVGNWVLAFAGAQFIYINLFYDETIIFFKYGFSTSE
jgi:hypothetical protein